tara:strand:- start:52414 stop:56691 length:4278 start_codon:yes stop_codon:yes gene_type:complete
MEELDDLLNGSLDIVDNPKNNLFSEEEFASVLPEGTSNKAEWTRRVDVGDTGLGDSQWDEGATIDEVQNGLNTRRAELQPWTDQLGNAITQAVVGEIVGGSIEGIGYLLDWQGIANLITGDEQEFTNWFSDIGKSIREGTQDATQIYEKTPGEMNLSDPGYWFKNSVSVASTLSMMLPSIAATKGLGMLGRGVSKLVGKGGRKVGQKLGREISKEAFDVSKKMGIQAEWMTEGMTQAVVSRHIENSMEASGTFEDIYNERMMQINPDTGKYFTDEEARLSASQGASENYKHGWAMLAQDMVQYLSIGKVFNPVTRQMEVARKLTTNANVPQWAKKTGAIAGTFLSEAGEEGYQHYIASRAKLKSELQAGLISKEEYDNQLSEVMSSDEAKTSMLFGGLGGSVFQAIGPSVNKAFKSKDRKEFEASASENFNKALGDRNKVLAALQIQKNKADQSGNEREIQLAQDDIIMSMVLDGIDSNNLEMVMKAIKDGPAMTEEEQAKFQEDNGYEWDADLAKQGAERALQIAGEVKAIHFKNLSKAKNKNVDSNIVKEMSRIEYQNNKYAERFAETKREQQKRIEGIQYDGIRKPSDRFKQKKDIQSKILATKEAIRRQTEALENAVDEDVKKLKSDIIKNHNFDLSELEKQSKELSKPDETQSRDQKEGDRRGENVYNKDTQFEIADAYLEQLELNDAMTENTLQLTKLNDKNFQKALINKQTEALIKSTNDKDMLNTFKERIEKGEVAGYNKKSERETVLKQISERIAAINKEEKEKSAKEASDKAEAELKSKAASKNNNAKTPDNNVVVPVQEAIEDEHREEEIWFEEEFAEEQEQALETKVNNGKSIALLDAKSVTSAGYRQWIHDGTSKIGTKLRYEHAKRGMHLSASNKDSRGAKAVRAFNKAVKDKTEIPQSVYDHLPLQVFIGEGDKINTFLPEKPQDSAPKINKKRYAENYATERKNIIDGMARGEQVSSVIQYSAGGELQTQVDENGVVAENSIKDLDQVKKSKKRPHLIFSNLDGDLMEMDKKTRNKDFPAKSLSVGEDENGKPMPYRGGLFLVLRKADGTPFPVRLNFLKNTNEQAEVLADLLIDIAVPESRKTGTKKKYNLSTPLSLVEPGLQAKVREHLGAEVEFLKGDPTLKDIINMFVYVSEKTEGLTSQLYMKGIHLYFGGANNYIKPENRTKKRQELVEFLRDTKRRQLNINMWNDTKNFPGYRDFVMDNKIINTNVVVGESEFQTGEYYTDKETGEEKIRRVQVWAKPVDSKVPAKPVEVKPEAPVKKAVQPDEKLIGAEDIIKEESLSLVHVNAEVNKNFKGKGYIYDGKSFKTITGKEIPVADMKVLTGLLRDMLKEYEARVTESSKEDDTQISKAPKKAVPSVPNRTSRKRRRSVGSGSTVKAKPNKTQIQKDDSVKKEDDKKQPKCKK